MYTRENPSPEYIKAVRLGREYHATKKVWTGKHILQQYPLLRKFIADTGAKTFWDFGSGKNFHLRLRNIRLLNNKNDEEKTIYPSWIEALGAEQYVTYDPCVLGNDTLPTGKYDGVFSCDVLHYITSQDINWVLDLMFSHANKFVFSSFALYEGKKRFSDGSLAHKSLRNIEWWLEQWSRVGQQHPDVQWWTRIEIDVPPLSHRLFHGMGERFQEEGGLWKIWKPEQLQLLTKKQREELEIIAQSQKHPIDSRAFDQKY